MKKTANKEVTKLALIFFIFGFAQTVNEYRVMFLEGQGLTATECGRVLAAASLLSAVSRPLAGGVADRLHKRRPVLVGALTLWLMVLAALLLTRNVRGAGFALCAGIVPLISVCEPVSYGMLEAGGVNAALMNPQWDFSLIRVCLSVGYSAINFAYTPIVRRFGPTAPFFCTMLFVSALLALSGGLSKFDTVTAAKPSQAKKLGLGRLFQNYFLISYVLVQFFFAVSSGTQSYLVHLINAIGMDSALLGVASGLRVLGEIIVMPLVPLMKRRLSLPMLLIVSCLIRMAQVVLFLTIRNPYVILGVIALSGISGGILISASAVYLRTMAPEGLDTTTLSLSNVMSCFGSIVMSLAGGVVVDDLGIFALYRISLGSLCLWLALFIGSWLFGTRVLKKEPPVPMFPK